MASLAPFLLTDGRLPVGAHTYSAGLEPAVAAGLTRARVPALLRARLHTGAVTEAAAAVLALRAALHDPVDYDPVQRALAARTPVAPCARRPPPWAGACTASPAASPPTIRPSPPWPDSGRAP